MKVLIIEDNLQIANLVKFGLEKEGYTVDHVADGEAGQKRIELYHKEYDLIIMDLMLPGKDGFEICRSVRELGISTPILVLTAKGYIDDKVSALGYGADDYLVKPFEFRELVARIKALLRRPEKQLSPRMKIGSIVLDSTSRKVYVNDKEIKLTLKEFGLLEYFMRNPNKVVTRDEILFNLWDFDFNSFSNVVDVHINNLRKKINNHAGGKKKTLETIRGVGYRLGETSY